MPVTAGIQPVRVDYANTIDTVGGKEGLKKSVLLASSRYAAAMKTPCSGIFVHYGGKDDGGSVQ